MIIIIMIFVIVKIIIMNIITIISLYNYCLCVLICKMSHVILSLKTVFFYNVIIVYFDTCVILFVNIYLPYVFRLNEICVSFWWYYALKATFFLPGAFMMSNNGNAHTS